MDGEPGDGAVADDGPGDGGPGDAAAAVGGEGPGTAVADGRPDQVASPDGGPDTEADGGPGAEADDGRPGEGAARDGRPGEGAARDGGPGGAEAVAGRGTGAVELLQGEAGQEARRRLPAEAEADGDRNLEGAAAGMDANSSYLLQIRMLGNPKKARKEIKSFYFEKVIDSDLTNYEDLVESIIVQYPPRYLEVAHVHYYDGILKTFPEIKSDQDLLSMFEKHNKTKMVLMFFAYCDPSEPYEPITEYHFDVHLQSDNNTNQDEENYLINPIPENEYVGIDEENMYFEEEPMALNMVLFSDKEKDKDYADDESEDESENNSDDKSEDEAELEVEEEVHEANHAPNIEYDKADPPMTEGSIYPNMDEFKLALSQHAIKHEFEYNTEKSTPFRFRGYCTRKDEDNCPWRIHASTTDDMCTVVVKKNPCIHDCSSARRKKKVKNATKYWVCEKVKDWLIEDATLGPKELQKKLKEHYKGPNFAPGGMSSASSSQSPASTEREATTANDEARPPDPGTDSAGPARSRLSLQLDQRSLHFAVNAWVLIVALIGILPLATRQLPYKGYRLSLLGTTCTTGYALFALYGLPRVGNTQAVQAWGHLVTSSKDFLPFMYCLMFVTSKLHLKLVLVPVICWALEHVARFLRRHFSNSSLYRAYLEPLCTWVDRNTTAVNFLIANAEILLGFLLILSIFSKQRNVMQTFMYWQLLKLMYHSPFTAGYHRAIWLKIGRTVNPYIHSYTPFLHDPMNAGMRWWFR